MPEKLYSIRVETVGDENLARLQSELTKLEAVTKSVGLKSQQNVKAFASVGAAANSNIAPLKNMGYQIQDIAVQIASGQSAMRAMAQQIPQLASGFGVWGVALGTAAAVLIPLAGHLLDFGEATKTTDEALADLKAAADALAASGALAAAPIAARAEYQSLIDVMVESAELQRRTALTELVDSAGIVDAVAAYQGLLSVAAQTGAEVEQFNLLGLEHTSEALFLQDQLNKLKTAEAGTELEILDSISEALQLRGALTDEVKAFLTDLANTLGIQQQVKEGTKASADEMTRFANEARIAAAQVEAMGAQIRGVLSAAVSLSLSNVGISAEIEALKAGVNADLASATGRIAQEREKLQTELNSDNDDIRKRAESSLAIFTAETYEQAALLKQRADLINQSKELANSANSISGGSATAYAKEAEELQKLYEKYDALLRPVDEYTQQLEDLKRLKDSGVFPNDDIEELLDLLDQLRTKQNEWSAALQTGLEDGLGAAVEGLIQGTYDWGDAFEEVAKQVLLSMADIAAQWAAYAILSSVFPGGGFVAPNATRSSAFRAPTVPTPANLNTTARSAAGASTRSGISTFDSMGTTSSSSSSDQPNITVNNYTPADVNVQQIGNQTIITVEDVARIAADTVARDISRGGNPVARATEVAYGLNRRANPRR